MFVVEIGSVLTTLLFLRDLGDVDRRPRTSSPGLVAAWLWFTVLFANFAEAMAEGRGKAQADTLRQARTETMAHRRTADGTDRAGASAAARTSTTSSSCRAGEIIPVRRRGRRGHRLRRRVGHHRRVGARDPGVRRRPLGGHRRHPGAVRPDRRAHHRRAGRDLPRPHDRPRRGRQPAEDPQRDRPEHPAGRADDHLPAGHRDPPALRHLLRRRAAGHRPRRPARLPDPDDHRRAALAPSASPAWTGWCSATCWPCPAGPSRRPATAPRCCSTRPGTITLGNRQAAEFLPLPGVERGAAGRGRPAVEPGRRDARGTFDRGAGQGALRPPRARVGRRHAGALHRPDPHERRRPRRAARPQGRGRLRPALGRGAGRRRPAGAGDRRRGRRHGRRHAAGRGRRHPESSASSTSRTSSRRASPSGSTQLRGWASAR